MIDLLKSCAETLAEVRTGEDFEVECHVLAEKLRTTVKEGIPLPEDCALLLKDIACHPSLNRYRARAVLERLKEAGFNLETSQYEMPKL